MDAQDVKPARSPRRGLEHFADGLTCSGARLLAAERDGAGRLRVGFHDSADRPGDRPGRLGAHGRPRCSWLLMAGGWIGTAPGGSSAGKPPGEPAPATDLATLLP